MPAGSNENSPGTTPVSLHSEDIAVSSQSSELIETDPVFLQRLRLYWQLGDWTALEALSEQDIKATEARAECALYIAAACFQLGLLEKGKTYHALALQWGASKLDVGRVLVSGVYNNLAAASVIIENQASPTALQHFLSAAQVALPGVAVASVVKARTQNQLERLNRHTNNFGSGLLQLEFPGNKPTDAVGVTEAIAATLQQYYVFDETLKIWRRNEQHEFAYNDGDEIEQRILAALKSCEDVSVFSRELLPHKTDWASEYHLSADRVNLLRPFTDHLEGAAVLELGCGCGAITRFLGESGATVTAVEGSQQRASVAAERCRDLNNVTVVLDKLQNVPFNQQFDVVTLIGVLEYSRIYVEAEDPVQFVLHKARSYLKPDGILIVAIENQLGLKYFAGAPEDHGVGIMAGINDLYHTDTAVTFGKHELQQRFMCAGFSRSDTYLPFPDYKLPCLIVHPAGYSDPERFDLGNLLASTVFYDRQGIANPMFSLESSWPLISRNGLAAELANSHLFVVHNTDSKFQTAEDMLASYYSPKRSAATSQEVTFIIQDKDVSVRRRRLGRIDEATEVTSEPYVQGVLHSQLLNRIVQRPGWTLAEIETWMQQWLDALEQKIVADVNVPQGWPEYDKWLPVNFIDAIPRNLLINEKGFSQFIDLEWTLPHELPLPLVLYRGLVVTLSTITSVASPADSGLVQRQYLLEELMRYCGYSLETSDYQLFVPLIDALSRKAQGLEPITTATTQAVMLKPFSVRQSIGMLASHSNCMTLYWRRADTAFCEEHTLKYQYFTDGKQQCLELSLPAQPTEYTRFRLDIGESQGCYELKEMVFRDADGSALWQWDFDIQQLSNIGQMTFYQPIGDEKGICLMSQGSDPQFELDLPQDVLTALSGGGTLTIKLCAYA